ncbi:hypothetical protein N2152v2_007042 [Parachlorella kessleri]
MSATPMEAAAEPSASQAGLLPPELLRLVLQQLLGDTALEAYPLVKIWEPFALVCKAWLEAARSTPLRINLGDLPELEDDVIDWLARVTLLELELSPSHFTIDLFRHRPQFLERSGGTLRRLLGAQLAADSADALRPADFPHLEELDLHSDEEMDGEHHFDAGCLAALQHLTALSLSDFSSVCLARLPAAGAAAGAGASQRACEAAGRAPAGAGGAGGEHHVSGRDESLKVGESSRVKLAKSNGVPRKYVPWAELCRQVSDDLSVTAPLISLLLPPGMEVPPPGGEAALVVLTQGFMEGRVAHAELVLNHLELVAPDPGAKREEGEHYVPAPPYDPDDPHLEHPWFRTLHSVDQLGVQAYFGDNPHARHFGTFFQPDTPEIDDAVGLYNGTRFELVRHSPGEPLQLGYANELQDHQMDFLLSGVQVKRLALEHVPAGQVAALLSSPAFQQSSAATLRMLEGVELRPGLALGAYSALEQLVAYVGPAVELGPHTLPANLVHLELCADTQPPALEDVDPAQWQEDLLEQFGGAGNDGAGNDNGGWPAGEMDPPVVRFDAAAALGHLRQLKDLCLTAFHDMDLAELPPTVATVLIQDPDFQHPMSRRIAVPYRLALPRALPPARPSLELSFRFSPSNPSPVAGRARWPPSIHLDELLAGGVTQVNIMVEDDGPPSPDDLDEDEEPPPLESWTLTVQCCGSSLREVMEAVTASPLHSITFDAAVVRFQGGVATGDRAAAAAALLAARSAGDTAQQAAGAPPVICSAHMQGYIEAEWGQYWRVIPLDVDDEASTDLEGDGEAEEPWGEDNSEEGLSERGGSSSEELGSDAETLSSGSRFGRPSSDAFTLKRR